MTQKEIENIATNINNASLHFHLSHAIGALNIQLRNVLKEYSMECIDKLNEELLTAIKQGNEKEITRICKDIGALQKPGRVYIEYVNMAEDAGRVTKTDNNFIILLPMSLAKKSMNEHGIYNANIIQKLRKIIAHELGHIALHTKEMLEQNSLQGSKDITVEENEADIFAKKLLELRQQRNQKLYDCGAI